MIDAGHGDGLHVTLIVGGPVGSAGGGVTSSASVATGESAACPAELLGLPGGTLRSGAPADVVVIDPDVPWVLDRDELKSKCRNTPFDEARLQGRAVRTIVAGRTVYEYV